MISYTDFVWDGPNLRLYSTRGRIVATIVPDSEWAGMWRVKIGAEISDMVNLTRAKDAARSLALADLNGAKTHISRPHNGLMSG